MKKTAIIFLLLLTAASAGAAIVRSNRDPRVDQDLRTTASPTFVDLILTGANISSDNPIGFRPSGDNNDYLSFSTVSNIPTITTIGGALFNITSDIPGTGSLIGFTGTSGTGMQIGWLESTGARIFLPLGVFNLMPSNDSTDYFQFSTVNNVPTMQAIGGSLIDFPGMSFTGIGGIDMSGTLSFVTNTIADGQFTGDWSLNGGDLTEPGHVDGSVKSEILLAVGVGPDEYWRFEGNGTATVGTNATHVGGSPTYCDRGTTKAWQGSGEENDRWTSVTQGPLGSDARTIMCWIKNSSVATSPHLIGYGKSQDYRFGIQNASILRVTTGSGFASAVSPLSEVTDGQWHHLAVTMADGGAMDEMTFYVDGIAVASTGNNSTTINTVDDTTLHIGSSQTGGNRYSGCLDEAAVFGDVNGDGSKMDPADIYLIYLSQRERIIQGTGIPHVGFMAGPISTLGNITAGGDLDIAGDADIGGDLEADNISALNDLFVGRDLYVDFLATFYGGVSIDTFNGIIYGDGTDVDIDIATIAVTGSPRFWWDESEDEFVFTKPISAPAYRGASDIHMDEDGIFFGVDDEAKIHVGLTAELVDAWILESLDPDHDLLLKTARSFKFEAVDDMEISVQVFGICIDDNSHVEIENGLIEFFGNGPTGEDETILTMSNDDTIPIFTFDARRSNINILGYPGDIGPGESYLSTHINIDETLATSSDATTEICGLDFGTTTSQAATKVAMCVNAGFDFALVIRGAVAEDPNQGYENTSGVVVDRVNSGGGGNDAFISDTTNVVIFDNQNDYILIGSNATFEDIQVALDIPSSGSIFSNPTVVNIYYSRAGGNWALLTILDDGTHGFQSSGNITFNAPGDWTKDDEDMDGNPITNALYILVQRTRAVLGTPPTELSFKTFASLKTGAAIRGDGTFKPVSLPDSLAENESIYYSSTQGNLVYKDSGGTVHDLY